MNLHRTLAAAAAACLLLTPYLHPQEAAAAPASPPALTEPEDGTTLRTFAAVLSWSNPSGTRQVHLQLIPFNNDGPGVNLYFGSALNSFKIPAPPEWYGLLPDMTYTWRVRLSDADRAVELDDKSWGAWVEHRFRTPKVTSGTIRPLTPAVEDVVRTRTPVLQWSDRPDLFYYELQLSTDASFGQNGATAPVYSALLHGGVTRPTNGYAVPPDFPLDDHRTYYWKVRPRVGGDGTAIPWSPTYSFSTNTAAARPVDVDPVFFSGGAPDSKTCSTEGKLGSTIPSSVEITGVHFAFSYHGEGVVVQRVLKDGKVVATANRRLEQGASCMIDRLGAPAPIPYYSADSEIANPAAPGRYDVEIWYAGERLKSGTINVTPANVFALGELFVASKGAMTWDGCLVSGTTKNFRTPVNQIFMGFTYVGEASLQLRFLRGTTILETTEASVIPAPGSCVGWYWNEPSGFVKGNYTMQVLREGAVVSSLTFTVL